MPPAGRPLLTTGKKIVGNLLPLVLSVGLLVGGVSAFLNEGWTLRATVLLIAFPVVAWVATGLLGLPGNAHMKDEMARRWHIEHPFDTTEKHFVGFARPSYRGLLDAHEDVGFLVLHLDGLEFFGSAASYSIPRSTISDVRLVRNPHSWLGLGGFVAVSGQVGDLAVRMLFEPRSKATLFGNRRLRQPLATAIETWMSRAEDEKAEGQSAS